MDNQTLLKRIEFLESAFDLLLEVNQKNSETIRILVEQINSYEK